MENRLYRSRSDQMIFGICGGLGKYLGVDPTIVRIVFILLVFCGVGIPAYIVMAFVVPVESTTKESPKDVIEENVEDIKETATKLGEGIRDTFKKPDTESAEANKVQVRRRNALGIIVIVIGVLFLLSSLDIFRWFDWWGIAVAVALIAFGVLLITGLNKK